MEKTPNWQLTRIFRGLVVIVTCALSAATAVAADDPAFKFTLGSYHQSNGENSLDANLRWQNNAHTVWLGSYLTSNSFRQYRAGYEHNTKSENLRSTVSLQLASGGFLGGSLTGEIGPDRLFAILGVGRTNLQNYFNLNFDPNDMVQWGVGTHFAEHQSLLAYRIQDNRLGTGQKVTHLIWRDVYSDRHRITLDLFYKSGELDTAQIIQGKVGFGVGYDVNAWFVKLALDPNVNFTSNRMTRISIGVRF